MAEIAIDPCASNPAGLDIPDGLLEVLWTPGPPGSVPEAGVVGGGEDDAVGVMITPTAQVGSAVRLVDDRQPDDLGEEAPRRLVVGGQELDVDELCEQWTRHLRLLSLRTEPYSLIARRF
ncbi:hypothetical protein HRbin27_00703 [bacterium HR27]|nr:hypothetical protein HRbin27_00703 [bacterium HR27]